LPIPHTTAVRSATRDAEAPLRIVSLGDARTEKGFALLGEAIAHLRAASRISEAEFIVQANIQAPAYAHLDEARARMRGLPGVTLIERALSQREYEELLGGADLVVLPYDQGVYRARTSGPFAEALAAGIPVVCTADTWMSDQLSTYGGGEQCRSGDPDSLAQAIERAVTGLPALTELAERRRDAWVAFHAPSHFSRMLRELVA